jgi:hypothetical protein
MDTTKTHDDEAGGGGLFWLFVSALIVFSLCALVVGKVICPDFLRQLTKPPPLRRPPLLTPELDKK